VLRASGKRHVVIIASDGVSTDGDVQEAMRALQSLPVWVVIRLCTDDDEVCLSRTHKRSSSARAALRARAPAYVDEQRTGNGSPGALRKSYMWCEPVPGR